MTDLSMIYVMAAGYGALVAVYVILAVLIALGVYALVRLGVLAKRQKKPAVQEKDCENCPDLKEKEGEIDALKERIKELEARPILSPIVILPEKEKTLSESIAAVKETGTKGLISKKSIIAYLSDKYGDKVELNGRANKTPNGKLLLSDNHFAFSPAGKRVCFTYVYETDEDQVLSLIRLDEAYVAELAKTHGGVAHSAFPKNKEKDWYSVVADDSFTEASYYAVLDHAIAIITDRAEAVPEPEVEVSLKESLAVAKETGAVGIVTKKSIIEHLDKTFGDKVELNGRENRTPNGKLLMSDNHFAFSPAGKRVCFTYIYEDDGGEITILLRTTEEHAKDIHKVHEHSGIRSAFPKNKERDWYSVIVDSSYSENAVYADLDRAVMNIIGASAEVPEPEVEVSLKESLAVAKETGAVGIVTKKSIIEHLDKTFGDKVELNGRENRTPNGKLLMSDNHFAFSPAGKRVCFTYIYEDDGGEITILLRTTAEHAKDIRASHKSSGIRSAFPKNKERDWYSVIVDDSYTESGVYADLDRAAMNIIGAEVAATTAEPEPEVEVTLKESLTVAKETGAVGIVTKKSIIEHLDKTFGDKVELNGRENRTPNGKLLMSDNHFAFSPAGKRVCFTYIYEDDDGKITILLRTTEEHAKDIHKAHEHSGIHSAFPKNKEKDWYSVIVDNSFTEAGVYAELDRAAMNIIGAEVAAAEEISEKEVSLKESLAVAKETGAVGIVTKKSIFEYLDKTFGDKVELNGRENRTPNGKLLMSDNHFAFSPAGKRVCFTYIYEDDGGEITILLRTTEEHAKDIHKAHAHSGIRSAFPKNKERDWYSVIVDSSYSENAVYADLDRAAMNIIGAEVAAAEEIPEKEVSLKESLAVAKETGAVGIVTKKSIIEYLSKTFGDKVELNGRENRTPNGKLLMSDNHFAFAPDGKRVCFTYIYEDGGGEITILLRTTEEHAKDIHKAHAHSGIRSAFPKNKERDWYSVIVDNSFTEADVWDILKKSISYVTG